MREYQTLLEKNKNARHPFDMVTDPNRLKTATVYHAMVHPVTPLALRGILWCQGESNVGDPADIHPRDKKPVGERLARLAPAGRTGKRVSLILARFSKR